MNNREAFKNWANQLAIAQEEYLAACEKAEIERTHVERVQYQRMMDAAATAEKEKK